jgi:ribonuclease HI
MASSDGVKRSMRKSAPKAAAVVDIYTDGACSGNPGPGGWGAVLSYQGKEREIYGAEADTTNNRMELTAAIKGLESLTRPVKVRIFTDSVYVKDGITLWIENWKAKGWKTAKRKPVKNEDLWRRLETAAAGHEVEWCWIKGHTGDAGNERADALARRGVEEITGKAY